MEPIIITIARHYGSGGKTIGEMLAKELGVNCYNREILRMASQDSGINESLFNQVDEVKKWAVLFRNGKAAYQDDLIPPESDDFVSNDNLFNYQARIIKRLADTESCVIIGRCADYVLREYPNVVRVFVHAPEDYCLIQAKERSAYKGRDMEKYIARIDKYRSNFYRYYTGQVWDDARNYDLCLDSSRLGFEGCVAAIKAYTAIRFPKNEWIK